MFRVERVSGPQLYVDGSALRRRYLDALQRAGPPPRALHDLRHTFGTRVIAKADIVCAQEWMGHDSVDPAGSVYRR